MYLIDALERALSRVIQFMPTLVAAFVILAIGWLIAEGLGVLTTKLISRTDLDERLVRYDVIRAGAQAPSKTAGRAVFWLIFLVALASAANMLGIPSLEGVIARFIAYIPNLVAAGAILAVGYVVARFLSRIAVRLVEINRIDERVESQPIGARNVARVTNLVVFWGIFLVALGAAADSLQIAVVSRVISTLVAYLPHFVLAALMIGVGVAIGSWVKSFVLRRGKSASTEFAGSAAKGGIIVLAAFMAANELGVGSTIVTIAFAMVVGAAAVAFAIAFGLGSRDVANRVARDWYDRAQRITKEPPVFRPSRPSTV